MVFGAVGKERIQLNEETLWDGYPRDTTNPEARKALPEVRRLIFEGKNREAERLAGKALMGRPPRVLSYQTLGDLRLDGPAEGAAADYRRALDLATGIASVEYTQGGVRFHREMFVSAPGQVLVLRITAEKPGSIRERLTLTREQDARCLSDGPAGLALVGQIGTRHHETGEVAGLHFEARLIAFAKGGQVKNEGGIL